MGGNPETDRAKKCVQKVRELLKKNGNIVEKIFVCQGAIDPNLINKFREMTKQGIAGPFGPRARSAARPRSSAAGPRTYSDF